MSHTDRVRAFIGAWEARDVEAILAAMTPDAVYHNIPMPVMQGHDAIRAFAAPFLAGCSKVEWTLHHIAESSDGIVLTERTDVFILGPKTISIRVMGTFEFTGGLISAWRDYFDLAEFQRQMA